MQPTQIRKQMVGGATRLSVSIPSPHVSTTGKNFGTPNALTTLAAAFTIASAGIVIRRDFSSAFDKPRIDADNIISKFQFSVTRLGNF